MFKFLLDFIPGVGPFLSAAASGIGDFVSKHWKVLLVALMLGTIAYQNFSSRRFVFFIETIPYLESRVATDEAQIKKLQADVVEAATANATLTRTIQDDNATVKQWMTISDSLQKQTDALVGTLKQMNAENNKTVTSILNSKTPQTCEESIQFLRDEQENLKW